MPNKKLADIFYEMADILELSDVQWKPRAYRQAAREIEGLKLDVSELYKKGGLKGLEELPGIGEGIGKKIVQFIEKGKVDEHEKLKKGLPSHLNLLMKIPGMGAKKVKKLNSELNIKNIKELEVAAKKHLISAVEGFGEKSEQEILENIENLRRKDERIPLKKAETIAKRIIDELKDMDEVDKISIAGSLRRKKETIGDIDILISSDDAVSVFKRFDKLPEVKKVLSEGKTKASVILQNGVQVDLRVIKPESWGAGLFYFTGSKEYNINMRKEAIKKGWKLNEYGLFSGVKMIAGKTEEEICKKLGVKFLKPEERE